MYEPQDLADQKTHTALLLFARSSSVEAIEKNIAKGRSLQQVRQIYQSFNERIASIARGSSIPFYIIDEKRQSGSDFGTRIASAFQLLFDKGHDNVICIGNDCPNLDVGDIRIAQQQLMSGKQVLGPDRRGGTYLIGIQRSKFRYDEFAKIEWQTTNTFHALTDHFGATEIALLDQKSDINQWHDLVDFIKSNTRHYLRRIIICILRLRLAFLNHIQTYHQELFLVHMVQRRGPPLYQSIHSS